MHAKKKNGNKFLTSSRLIWIKMTSHKYSDVTRVIHVIYLNICAIRGHKIFVDVGSGLPDTRLGRINAAPASDFPEKSLTSATCKT